jgi:S-(hydroxymethyl)glutathione dehydrogenase/alcohol dehydrogenase
VSRKIRAAVMYDFNAPLVVEEVELKEPKDDQVVVKMVATGFCRTDLSVLHGLLPYPPPLVLGHEGAGIVEEVGKNVVGVRPGDHVITSFVQHCGECHYCRAGRAYLCERGVQAAIEGSHMTFEKDGQDIARFGGVGSLAEKTLMQSTAVFKIPEGVPLNRACLIGCGVITGVGAAVNTVKIHPGDTVAVLGCGGVGMNVIQGAALSGAGRILAVDVDPRKLEAAKKFGATETVQIKEGEEVSEEIRSRTDGLGVDFAFEVIGVPEVIRQAFFSLKRGGKAVVVGVAGFGQDVALPASMIALEERSVVGSLYGSATLTRDIPRLLDLYQRGRLKLDELVTKEIPLDRINEAVAAMESGTAVRSVIRFD